MLRDGHITPSQRKHLETIAAQCNRQIDLVLNLLDLSRIESLSLEPARVEAGEVVRSCLQIERPAAELRGHAIQANIPSELPPVLADRSALRRVLCSLVENAIKYTPDSGRITLGARAMDDTIAISVTDTGRGIGPQDIRTSLRSFIVETGMKLLMAATRQKMNNQKTVLIQTSPASVLVCIWRITSSRSSEDESAWRERGGTR